MKGTPNALASAGGRLVIKVAVVLTMFTLVLAVHYASPAWADTFTVTNLNDSGPGSLRAAMNAAEAKAGADEIVFADGVSGTITLASTLPMVTDPAGLVIDGGGDVTVSGNEQVQIFSVGEGAALSLRSLTLSSGLARAEDGGAINNVGGTVVVTNSTVSRNEATFLGGGIHNIGGGAVTITNSTISGNTTGLQSVGGGIYNENSTLEVINSTFSNNGNGAIRNRNSTLEVTNSTFSDHQSGTIASEFSSTAKVTNSTFTGNRGGVLNGFNSTLEVTNSTFLGTRGSAVLNVLNGTLEVTNSTFSGNRGVGRRCDAFGDCVEFELPGGGIYNSGGTTQVTNSTFSGNSASTGSAIFNGNDFNGNEGKTTLRNTIVANSTSGGNCGGEVPITDGGYNIDDGSTCGFTQATGSLPNTNPLLDPAGLADNGGQTQTIALQPDSPAVDLVGQDACPPPETDQRGVERPQGEACDAGAFELVQSPQTKADCKQGGWEEFGFNNQGRCVAFVNRAARNND